MALMDHIREARAKMADGTLTENEAARQLAEASEGGLTTTGARSVLNQHPADVEAQYGSSTAGKRTSARRDYSRTDPKATSPLPSGWGRCHVWGGSLLSWAHGDHSDP